MTRGCVVLLNLRPGDVDGDVEADRRREKIMVVIYPRAKIGSKTTQILVE